MTQPNFSVLKIALEDAIGATSEHEVRAFIEDQLHASLELRVIDNANIKTGSAVYTYQWCATRLAHQQGRALTLSAIKKEVVKLKEITRTHGINLDELATVIKWHGSNWRSKYVPRCRNAFELFLKFDKLKTAMDNPMNYAVNPDDAKHVTERIGRYIPIAFPLTKFVHFHTTTRLVTEELLRLRETVSEYKWTSDPLTGHIAEYESHARLLQLLTNLPFIDGVEDECSTHKSGEVIWKKADYIIREYTNKMDSECGALFNHLASSLAGVEE